MHFVFLRACRYGVFPVISPRCSVMRGGSIPQGVSATVHHRHVLMTPCSCVAVESPNCVLSTLACLTPYQTHCWACGPGAVSQPYARNTGAYPRCEADCPSGYTIRSVYFPLRGNFCRYCVGGCLLACLPAIVCVCVCVCVCVHVCRFGGHVCLLLLVPNSCAHTHTHTHPCLCQSRSNSRLLSLSQPSTAAWWSAGIPRNASPASRASAWPRMAAAKCVPSGVSLRSLQAQVLMSPSVARRAQPTRSSQSQRALVHGACVCVFT
jgi:hypothetical protein